MTSDISSPQQRAIPEADMLKATICMKEHEIFALRGELERSAHEHQMLIAAMERIERTVEAAFDRLIRRLERHGVINHTDKRKRR